MPVGFRSRQIRVGTNRIVAYGYRENESLLIPPLVKKAFINNDLVINMDKTLEITRFRDCAKRPVVMADLGLRIPGVIQPHPDPGDTHTIAAGSLYRFCREIPNSGKYSEELNRFTAKWLEANMPPLEHGVDTTFETWIQQTPYTLARKEELTRKLDESNYKLSSIIPDKVLKVSSFMKDETYPTYKHARAINSRSDVFKSLVGPIFQLIGSQLFKLPWFIKKIPINERPQYIIDLLKREGSSYIITDYTSFEAHFTKSMMEDCELQLLKHMVQHIPEGKSWYDLVHRAKTGINDINFKNVSLKIEAKRMSGEMDTSLSNGFANLMFMLFMMDKVGATNVAGVIEGDDGLFVATGEKMPTKQDFLDLGLMIKLDVVQNLEHASFCGMVFDLDDRTNVTNPIAELVSFGWTTARYARSKKSVHMCLLRSKALSLAYQYPACPILSTLAYKVCQLTASYDSRKFLQKQGSHAFNLYEMEIIQKSHDYFEKHKLLEQPGISTRLLVEKLYGISIQDQLTIENYINKMETIEPICCPEIYSYVEPMWVDYYERYTVSVNLRDDFNDLDMLWPEPRNKANILQFKKR